MSLYGFGQGLEQANRQQTEQFGLAERIRANRERERQYNEYISLAQDKWDTAKQQEELKTQALQMEIDGLKKQQAAKDAATSLFWGLKSGNFNQFSNTMRTNNILRDLMTTQGIVNIEGSNLYDSNAIKSFASGNLQLADDVTKNRNKYLIATDEKGNKQIVSAEQMGALMGIQNYVDEEEIKRLNTTQGLLNEQLQTQGLKAYSQQFSNNPQDITSKVTKEGYDIANPTASPLPKVEDTTIQQYFLDPNRNINGLIGVISNKNKLKPEQLEIATSDAARFLAQYGLKNYTEYQTLKAQGKLTDEQKQIGEFLYPFLVSNNSSAKKEIDKAVREDILSSEIAKTANLIKDVNTTAVAALTPLKDYFSSFFNLKLDPESVEVRNAYAKFQNVFNTILKIRSGAQVTDNELKRLTKELGSRNTSSLAMITGLKNLLSNQIAVYQAARNTNPYLFDQLYGGVVGNIQTAHDELQKWLEAGQKPSKSSRIANSFKSNNLAISPTQQKLPNTPPTSKPKSISQALDEILQKGNNQ